MTSEEKERLFGLYPKPKHPETPRAYYNRLFRFFLNQSFAHAANFSQMVETSVDLDTRNTKNFNNRGLAVVQLMELAEKTLLKYYQT